MQIMSKRNFCFETEGVLQSEIGKGTHLYENVKYIHIAKLVLILIWSPSPGPDAISKLVFNIWVGS
jgi:hypothetical protein